MTLKERAALLVSAGQTLGPSDWHTLTEDSVNRLEEVTRGEARLKVDPDAARGHVLAGGAGGTIVPGYVTLAVGQGLLQPLITVEGEALHLDRAVERVRFITPVIIGQAIRTTATVREVRETADAVDLTLDTRIEVEGAERPACVVAQTVRWRFVS